MESKLEDLKNLKHYRTDSRYHINWKPFMEKYHCDTICEVGVQHGYHFKCLIEHNPKLAVAVDNWLPENVYTIKGEGTKRYLAGSRYLAEEVNQWYELFKKENENKPFVKICRGFAHDVVKEFPDEFFDFVYIDADHTYEAVNQDIRDWYPKVKTGGVLSGHDYAHRKIWKSGVDTEYGVIRAVDEFVKEKDIKTFFKLSVSVWGFIK